MASKAEKAPSLPPMPAELWKRDGNSLVVDGDEYDAWAAGYGRRVERAELEAERHKLIASESEARAKRMRLEQQQPWLVPGQPQRSYNAFQLVSVALQVFLVVAVLAMAARMLRPTPVETRLKPSPAAFEPAALPE